MKASFIELPTFQRLREHYFDDAPFKGLQNALMENPEAGDVIQGTGGLRKLRFGDARRGAAKESMEDCVSSTSGKMSMTSSGCSLSTTKTRQTT